MVLSGAWDGWDLWDRWDEWDPFGEAVFLE
jgi:hypothetical protein